VKILVVNWQDITNPLAGGAEVHLHEVFERIARMGHEVTLYCSRYQGAAREETRKGMHIIREGGRSLFNFRWLFAYFTRFRHERYDVVVEDMNKIPFFTPLYVRAPVMGITHHLFGTSIFREANPIVATYVWMMESLAVALYRARHLPFIVGSPSTYQELMAKGFPPSSVTIVNYAVDHALHRPTGVPRNPTPLIGYFGRLKKYKSVDHLLLALPRVLAQVPDLRLMIVGEGDDRPRLEQVARDQGVGAAVTFTGFVTEEEKVALLQKMWFKVTTSSKEGWGLTVLEANACGTTVLASNVQGLRDAVKDGETGLLYAYGNIDELAEKILLLVRDENLRVCLVRNALAWAASFSWDKAAAQTMSLLEERVKTHGGRGA
jgi:glycosyltransferase involved in cell wall biosynthesis